MNQGLLYPISVEGRCGFINEIGEVVIPPVYLEVSDFHEGLARVSVPGTTYEDRRFAHDEAGFIDESMNYVIKPGAPRGFKFPRGVGSYSYGDFHEGMARFHVGDATGLQGYIDRTGDITIPPIYASVGDFSEGLACVSLRRSDRSPFGPKLTGFINQKGDFVIPATRCFVASAFSEGRCVLSVQDDHGKWNACVIDRAGSEVVPLGIYSTLSDFAGGVATAVRERKVGCINLRGEIVIPFEFDRLCRVGGESLAIAEKDGQHLIVDQCGKTVRVLPFDGDCLLGGFSEGLAEIKVGSKWGFIDRSGDIAISLQFDYAESFRGALARVRRDGRDGYVNRRGTVVWETACWNEPIRNAVLKPLADFLPPGTLEALPLEYNRGGCKNAIVFAANLSIDLFRAWLSKTWANEFEFSELDEDDPKVISIRFNNDGSLDGLIVGVDVAEGDVESCLSFYASDAMKHLLDKHKPTMIGILLQDD